MRATTATESPSGAGREAENQTSVVPGFLEVKRWIRQAAAESGARVSERHAKALAGAYLTTLETDHALRFSSLTYVDEVGEAAVRAWFKRKVAQ